MDLSEIRIRGGGTFAALLALTIAGAGAIRANTVVVTGSTALTCTSVAAAAGTNSSTVLTLKLGTAITTGTLAVTVTGTGTSNALTGGITVTPLSGGGIFTSGVGGTGAASGAGITYTVTSTSGCAAIAASTNVIFTPAAGTANTQAITDTVANALVVTGAQTITCDTLYGPSSTTLTLKLVTPLLAGTLTVTPSGATGGLVVTPLSGAGSFNTTTGGVSGAGITYTISDAAGCSGSAVSPAVTFTPAGGSANVVTLTNTTTTGVPVVTAVLSGSTPTCNTLTGPGAASGTITLNLATAIVGPNTVAITTPTLAGFAFTAPATPSFSAGTSSLVYHYLAATGCANPSGTVSFTIPNGAAATASLTETPTNSIVTAAVSAQAITCNTVSGPGASGTITLSVSPALTSGSVAIPTPTLTGFTITPPGTTSFSSTLSSLVYTYNAASGCSSASGTFTFVVPVQGNVTAAVTSASTVANPLVVSPPAGITVQCVNSGGTGGTWAIGPAQTISLSTLAPSGSSAYTVNQGTSVGETIPAPWLTLSSSAGTATSTGITFTVQATPSSTAPVVHGCGGYTSGSHVTTIYLDATGVGGAPAKSITVTLQMVTASLLTVSPSVSLTYIKNSGTPSYVDLPVSSTPSGLFLTVNTASLPNWLTVDSTTGSLPKSFRFTTTSVCDSLPPGTYTATVYLQVSGELNTPVNISLLLTNKAPSLSVALPPASLSPGLVTATSTATMQNINWTVGTSAPTTTIIAESSDSPIGFTAVGGGSAAPTPLQGSGFALSSGTQIGVTFGATALASAAPGTVLTGTVTLTWGPSASTVVVTFNITVVSAAPTLTSVLPSSIPTATAPNTYTVTLTGTGFVAGSDPTLATKLGIVVNGSIVTDSNLSYTGNVYPASILLTINVPALALGISSDVNLTQFVTPGPLEIGICNPAGASSCSAPQAVIILNVGAGPIIQAVTSASSFAQGTATTTSPYDMLTIFGANFCPTCGSKGVAFGTPDPVTQIYPAVIPLPPDVSNGNAVHYLTVTFFTHSVAGLGTWIGNAPLLFATNNQINLLVPAAVTATPVDVFVTYGATNAVATLATTGPALPNVGSYPLTIAATSPGMFTVGADGQGDAAILNIPTYAQITQANPAGMRAGVSDSDSVSLYVTGLGLPDSVNAAPNTAITGTPTPANCLSVAAYEALLAAIPNAATLTNIDGSVIQYSLFDPSLLPPCMASTSLTTIPAVKIGNVAIPAANVTYAGFVDSAVAGLYQINVQLPTTAAATFTTPANCGNTPPQVPCTTIVFNGPVEMPVQLSSQGQKSQAGVNIWVAPRLLVTPTPVSITGTVDMTVTGAVLATEGSGVGQYTYAVTSGILPAGLLFNTSSGAISGLPAANTGGNYNITVTATDQTSPIPLTGSVSIPIFINADLYLTTNPAVIPASTLVAGAISAGTFVTAKATGGTPAYTYSVTALGGSVAVSAGSGLLTDITVNSATGAVKVGPTAKAGTYAVVVGAQDATAGSPLTGTITFNIVLALNMSTTAVPSSELVAAAAAATPYLQVTATGGQSTYAYSVTTAGGVVIPPTGGLIGDIICSAGGAITVSSSAVAGTYAVIVSATDAATPGATGTTSFNVVLQ